MTSTLPLSGLGPLDLIRLLLARRRVMLLLPTIAAAVVIAVGLLGDRSWSAQGAIVAQSSSGNVSRLAGLAAQFGVAVPTGQAGQSPDYFADVLRSDGMLRRLLAAKYTGADARPIDLVAHLVPSALATAPRAELALRELRNRVTTSVGLKTGIVRIGVKLADPELARQVVAQAISELNALNISAQQTIAAQERRFTDERLAVARAELRQAEDRLEGFLRGNRAFTGGPQLVLQEDRLRRDVSLRQQVVVGLAQSLEQSRMEEVRNVPVISIVEAPVRPALPDSRKLVLKGLFAAIASGTLLFALLIAMEWRRRFTTASPEAAAEVEQLARETAEDLRRPWRMLARDRRAA
ncbi:MAG: hypothetical protein IPP90_04645 [Gemmatimonadaceae bacterium]|nr:hypothetical protein [Gemmatimonadaceae bacterium]